MEEGVLTFIEILEELEIPYLTEGHEHCREGWIQIDCPWCTPGARHWRMGYNIADDFVNCWACGSHGLSDTLVSASGRSAKSVLALLRGRGPSRFERKERTSRLVLPRRLGPLLQAHKRYLRERGLVPSEIERTWHVQGIGHSIKLAWRIFIPIYYHGDVVSWTTRKIADVGTRYISAAENEEAIPHKHLLYGEDYVRHAVIVTEGPFDVWRIGPGAVCCFGTSFTRAQVLKLSKYPTRVVCFDSEPTAQQQAKELCSMLECFEGETYRVELDSKDPGSATKKEILKLRRRFL